MAQAKAKKRAQPSRQAPTIALDPLIRPYPPAEILPGSSSEGQSHLFEPAPELDLWARAAFLAQGAPFYDERLAHLEEAAIAWLWAAEPLKRQGQIFCGTAELARPPANLTGWRKLRFEHQFRGWFDAPSDDFDFLITLWAAYCAEADDASFCATVVLELCHCGQQEDEFGDPKFGRSTGRPLYRIAGHDVEEHVLVVEMFGAGAAAGKTMELVEAAKMPPRFGKAAIAGACGTCLRRAA